MANFSYTATDKEGKIVKGNFNAADKDTVANMLISQGLSPLKISQGIGFNFNFSNLNNINIGQVPIKDKVIFFRELSVLISSGIPIVEAINISQAQVTNGGLKSILREVGFSVESGKSLSDSFAPHKQLFSEMQIQLIKTAEASGSLDYILDRIATETERASDLISKFKSAMMYPVIVIIVAIVAIAIVLTKMIPPMKQLYASFNANLPAPTQILINFSDFVIAYWVYIVVVLVIVVILAIWYRSTPRGREVTDKMFLKIPIIGSLLQKLQIISFGRTFILLVKSGVPLVRGLNMIADSMGNVVFKKSLRYIADEVEKGRSISSVMSQIEYFPPLLWRMVAIGEQTGKMEEVVGKVIEYYQSETASLIDNLSKIMEPLITIVLGIVVGFIGIAVYLPIYTLGNVIK